MLVDELMEQQDMLRSEADRHADGIASAARHALDLVVASALLAKPTRVTRTAVTAVCHDAGLMRTQVSRVILTPGDHRPFAVPVSDWVGVSEPFRMVTTGASYFLAVHRDKVRERDNRAANRRSVIS